MQTIVIAAFNHSLPSGLIGIADILDLAKFSLTQNNDHGQTKALPWGPKIIIASNDGSSITDGQGRRFNVDAALPAITHCDAVLIPGFMPDSNGRPPNNLTDRATRSWLVRQHRLGVFICGSCSGAFILGEAGLLNNHRCTTTWWLHYELKQRFPQACAIWGSGLVIDRKVITAGGPLSWVDITLHVVRTLAGAQAAKLTADFAVVDTSPKSQNMYVPQGYLLTTNPFLAKAEQVVRVAHDRQLGTRDLATAMAVSERTLHRRLKQLTGEAPKTFINRLRIDSASTLLQTSDQPIKSIAMELGYSDETVFRRLFRKQTGMTPTDYRRWLNDRAQE